VKKLAETVRDNWVDWMIVFTLPVLLTAVLAVEVWGTDRFLVKW
jgi:hypothetical protein